MCLLLSSGETFSISLAITEEEGTADGRVDQADPESDALPERTAEAEAPAMS